MPKKAQPGFFDQPQADLAGLDFCDTDETEEAQEQKIVVSTAKEMGSKEYPTLPFEGYYQQLLANPASDFWMVIYGLPFQGKTTFSIGFAKYLAENMGNVLYITSEQYNTEALRQVIHNVGAENLTQSLKFTPSLDKSPPLKQYDFIFIDSANAAELTYEQMKYLIDKYKSKAFVTVLQSTKAGDFRGDQRWRHKPSIVVKIDDHKAYVEKNQYITREPVTLPLPQIAQLDNSPINGLDGKKEQGKSIRVMAGFCTTALGVAKMLGETKESMQRMMRDNHKKVATLLEPILVSKVSKLGARVRIENFEFADLDAIDYLNGQVFFVLQLRGRVNEIKKVGDDYGGKLFLITEDEGWDEQ